MTLAEPAGHARPGKPRQRTSTTGPAEFDLSTRMTIATKRRMR
jgi:hypothetical protein